MGIAVIQFVSSLCRRDSVCASLIGRGRVCIHSSDWCGNYACLLDRRKGCTVCAHLIDGGILYVFLLVVCVCNFGCLQPDKAHSVGMMEAAHKVCLYTPSLAYFVLSEWTSSTTQPTTYNVTTADHQFIRYRNHEFTPECPETVWR